MVYQTEENSVAGIHRIIVKMCMALEKRNSLRIRDKRTGVSLLFHQEAKTFTVPGTLFFFFW